MVYEQWKFNYFDFGSWQSKIKKCPAVGSVTDKSCYLYDLPMTATECHRALGHFNPRAPIPFMAIPSSLCDLITLGVGPI